MIKMNKMNFIKTSDEETANMLRKFLHEVSMENNKYYVFVNDSTMKFDNKIDNNKVIYTNKMCI